MKVYVVTLLVTIPEFLVVVWATCEEEARRNAIEEWREVTGEDEVEVGDEVPACYEIPEGETWWMYLRP